MLVTKNEIETTTRKNTPLAEGPELEVTPELLPVLPPFPPPLVCRRCCWCRVVSVVYFG
jgi:hypothetical protein